MMHTEILYQRADMRRMDLLVASTGMNTMKKGTRLHITFMMGMAQSYMKVTQSVFIMNKLNASKYLRIVILTTDGICREYCAIRSRKMTYFLMRLCASKDTERSVFFNRQYKNIMLTGWFGKMLLML